MIRLFIAKTVLMPLTVHADDAIAAAELLQKLGKKLVSMVVDNIG